jgi:hypothetical protein
LKGREQSSDLEAYEETKGDEGIIFNDFDEKSKARLYKRENDFGKD